MFDAVVEPRRCARCGAEPRGHVVEHERDFQGFRLKLGSTTRFHCVECGQTFFIESPGRLLGMGFAALANFALAVVMLQLCGGPRKILERDDPWPAILVLVATGIVAYLVPRSLLSELNRRRNPRR